MQKGLIMTEVVTPETRKLTYNDRLIFYHPTQAGTGAAVRLAFRLRRPEEERDSCFFLEMAKQKTAPSRSEDGARTAATFDWQNRATGALDRSHWAIRSAQILAVFEDGKRDISRISLRTGIETRAHLESTRKRALCLEKAD